jgi:hypothetical protein
MKTPEDYIAEVKAASDAEWKARGFTLPAPVFSLERGSKYIRVVMAYPQPDNIACLGSRSVHCFLDKDGNIYKAESWKKPAKGIRGNINNDRKPLLGYQFYWVR